MRANSVKILWVNIGISLLLLCALLFTAFLAGYKPFLKTKLTEQLKRTFPGSEASLADCRFPSWRAVTLMGIEVKRSGIYSFKAGQVTVEYNWKSLLTGRITKVGVSGLRVEISTPDRPLADMPRYVHAGPSGGKGMIVETIVLTDSDIKVVTDDLKFKAGLAFDFSPPLTRLNAIALSIPSVESFGVKAQGIVLRSGAETNQGKMTVERVTFDKAAVEDVGGIIRMDGPLLFVDFLAVKTFGGRLEGHASLDLRGGPGYLVDLNFKDMQIARFIDDFELSDKVYMDGEMGGKLVLQGRGTDVRVLSGDFKTALGGGKLVIKDKRVMENVARSTNQPLDIIVENFSNYHYNTGNIGLSLKEKNIVLDLALDGETGKRNMSITLHEFLPKKDGP